MVHSLIKKYRYPVLVIALATAMLLLEYTFCMSGLCSAPPSFANKSAAYLDVSLPTEDRIDDLLSRMTRAEKIGQMALVEKNSLVASGDIATYGLGALLSGAGSKPADNTTAGWNTMVADYQTEALTTRLQIPLLYGVDAIHGHGHLPGATIFPHALGLGATQNDVLVEDVAAATAKELRATGINWSYSPNLDVPHDIRWGRVYEAFSDDSAVVARLGAAYVKGLQTKPADETGVYVLGTPKHYLGLGAMEWQSSSNKNFSIDQGVTPVSGEALRQVYLPPFQAALDAHALSVMAGLNSWGTTKLSAERYLLTDVLKTELGFTGFVVSDWYAVYEVPGGKFRATVKAINAGVDMVMLPFEYQMFVRHLTWANRLGLVSTARIDDAVRRILRAKFALGLFDAPVANLGVSDAQVIGSSEHRALARRAVAQSLVLLKNDEATLPISSAVTRIRVAGSAADNLGMQSGAWTLEWQGVDGNVVPGGTSILAGIQARVGAGVTVEYDEEAVFVSGSPRAQVGIAIVGEVPYAEGWGDRAFPSLSEVDVETIKRLRAVSDKVVVVTVSGRPLLIEHELPEWNALVAAWLPGSEGAGVVDVLFGDVPFTGRLPIAWPLTAEQLPITADGQAADGTALLFPSGFGLTL